MNYTNGSSKKSRVPVQVAGLEDVHTIAAGNYHVAALKHDGTVWSWGNNDKSQLGVMTASYSPSPVQIQGVTDVADITATLGHTIAIAKNDAVWAWGETSGGQWGNGVSMTGSAAPVLVAGYNGPVTMAAVVNPNTVLRDGSIMMAQANSDKRAKAYMKQAEVVVTASR